MAHQVPLSKRRRQEGWKAKVYDNERKETPHLTVTRGPEDEWRVSLRDKSCLVPPGGTWSQIPEDVRLDIEADWEACIAYWDATNPGNPVKGEGL